MKNYRFKRVVSEAGVVSATVEDCSLMEAFTGTITQNFDAETAHSGIGATLAHAAVFAAGGAVDKKIGTGQWGLPFTQ